MNIVVRTLIEQNGGDGKTVKKNIDTAYKKGIVWFNDERVAEWEDGDMKWIRHAEKYEKAYKAFIKKE